MDLEQAIAFLMGQDRNAVVTALMTKAQPLYQTIFDKGHATATAQRTPELQAAETAKTEAERQRDTEKQRADAAEQKLQAAQPERAKIDADWQKQLDDTKSGHKTEIAKLRTEVSNERLARAKADLKARLTAASDKYGMQVVDADKAEVLVEKPDTLKRFRFASDGSLEILQAGKEIPLQVGEGQAAIDLLAQEIKGTVEPKFLVSNADSGTGIQPAGGQGSGGQGGNNFFSRYRADLEAQRKKEAESKQASSGAQRLGIVNPAQ